MKQLLGLSLFLLIQLAFSQDINQMDAEGNRHGIWKKNYDNTDVLRYEGEFDHGKELGLFKFYQNIDGTAILFATKLFNSNNDIAEVTFLSSKGNVVSQGKMKGKMYIGEWLYYHKDSKQLMRKEFYDDKGVQQGELLIYYKDGTLAEKSFYKDGKMHGESFVFSEEGNKLKEFTYVEGELQGPSKYYSNSGELLVEGQYKRDKKHGIWKYYEDGELKEEKDFTIKSKNPYKQ